MKTIPMNHHYLPVFLQEGWKENGPRLVRKNGMFDRLERKPYSSSNFGCGEGLYSLSNRVCEDDQHHEPRMVIETKLWAKIDGFAAPIWKKMEAGKRLDDRDREGLAIFLSSLIFRDPHRIGIIREDAAKRIREYYAKFGENAPDPIIRKDGAGMFFFDWSMYEYASLVSNPELVGDLIQGQMHLIDCSAKPIPLSDRPLFRYGATDMHRLTAIPVNPSTLLVMSSAGYLPKSITRDFQRGLRDWYVQNSLAEASRAVLVNSSICMTEVENFFSPRELYFVDYGRGTDVERNEYSFGEKLALSI